MGPDGEDETCVSLEEIEIAVFFYLLIYHWS